MGQRLTIVLNFPNQVVNCYYHWSWYTESSLDLIQKIVNANKTLTDTDHIIRWVRLFEATWASLTQGGLNYALTNLNQSISSKFKVDIDVNRNSWLIAISPEWVEKNLDYAEHATSIKFDKDNTILSIDISDLFYQHEDPDEYEKCNYDLFDEYFDFNNIKPEQIDYIVSVIEKFDYRKTFTVWWDINYRSLIV